MDTNEQLAKAISLVRAGERAQAQRLLVEVLREHPQHEQAWLWASATAKTDTERRACLKRVLDINPHNQTAQQGLALLESQAGTKDVAAKIEPAAPVPSIACPSCGEANRQDAAFCRECGTCLQTHPDPSLVQITTVPDIKQTVDAGTVSGLAQSRQHAPATDLWCCPYCGFPNSTQASMCINCTQPLVQPFPVVPESCGTQEPLVSMPVLESRPQEHAAPRARAARSGSMPAVASKSPSPGPVRAAHASRPPSSNVQSDWGRYKLALAAKTLGITALIAQMLPICGLPIAVTGLVLGMLGMGSSRAAEARSGMIMCVIGLVLSIVNSVIGAILLSG